MVASELEFALENSNRLSPRRPLTTGYWLILGSQTPDADQAPPRVRMAMLIRGVPLHIREQPKDIFRFPSM